ncbi:MAG: hypothetical protein ABI634_18300 [Acidobacteriota bacterium]
MAEIDTLWQRDQAEAQRVMDRFLAIGGRHVMCGPVWANGYGGHFPATDWLSQPYEFAKFWSWLTNQVDATLVVAPDNAPFYDDNARTFDWGQMSKLTMFYAKVRGLGVIPTRVVSQWEQWQRRDVARRLFEWVTACFPDARRYWHNPPGHLSPGAGDEEERDTWQSALDAGMHGLYLQADPYAGGDGRSPKAQMVYDLADMQRRARGDHSPWGGPLLTREGQPMDVIFAEGTAHPMYWHGATQALAAEWADAALTVVTDTIDGIPSEVAL